MASKDGEYVAEFRKSLEGWTDERMITRQELEDVTMLFGYLVNLAESDGWVYTGHSLSMGSPMSRLVVRGEIDGIPHVVFSSGRTPTGCVRAFFRKMDEGWLEWQKDRFR